MGLNSTPGADRIHIGIFGKRNAGKSSIINALTDQDLAIVSAVKGTTTDPVSKAMELLPLGPVVIIDTPGLDDEGELGTLRVKKSYQVLNKIDIGLLVVDSADGISTEEDQFISRMKEKQIPFLVVMNKSDLLEHREADDDKVIWVSAKSKQNIHRLKEQIGCLLPDYKPKYPIVSDLVRPLDLVVLVIPIDSAAPKGRLILPQQQTIRELLEAGAVSIVVREHELGGALEKLGRKPALVITDSQAFKKVSAETPEGVLLTSFSILFSRHKGELEAAVKSVKTMETLEDGDKVLISEGCTHHRQCDDIGTVKIPKWIRQYTGKEVKFEFTSGTEFPDELSSYKMIVHCGGCMLNEREMKYRIRCAADQAVPLTNYGILIAYVNGILKRSIEIFPDIAAQLEGGK